MPGRPLVGNEAVVDVPGDLVGRNVRGGAVDVQRRRTFFRHDDEGVLARLRRRRKRNRQVQRRKRYRRDAALYQSVWVFQEMKHELFLLARCAGGMGSGMRLITHDGCASHMPEWKFTGIDAASLRLHEFIHDT